MRFCTFRIGAVAEFAACCAGCGRIFKLKVRKLKKMTKYPFVFHLYLFFHFVPRTLRALVFICQRRTHAGLFPRAPLPVQKTSRVCCAPFHQLSPTEFMIKIPRSFFPQNRRIKSHKFSKDEIAPLTLKTLPPILRGTFATALTVRRRHCRIFRKKDSLWGFAGDSGFTLDDVVGLFQSENNMSSLAQSWYQFE